MRSFSILIAILILLFSCNGQHFNDKTYNETYQVRQIPGLDSFQVYNQFDKEVDSIFPPGSFAEGGFKKNRSRIFMESFSNGKPSSQDSALYTGMPTPCYCNIDRDTLKIKVGIGFFGGMGYEIKVFKNNFQSNYFLYIDDVKPYKYSLTDKDFTGNLYLKNKFQTLILNEKPTLKTGQQVTGYLTFTSPLYYENSFGSNIDTSYVKGKLYFTCETK